jgi:hypothetical protein
MSKSNSIDSIKQALGSETVDLMNIFEKEGIACLKPKSFFGKDVFNSILGKVRDLGGRYENGLFTIPLKTEVPKKDSSPYEELHQKVMDLRNYVEKETTEILKKIGDLKRNNG